MNPVLFQCWEIQREDKFLIEADPDQANSFDIYTSDFSSPNVLRVSVIQKTPHVSNMHWISEFYNNSSFYFQNRVLLMLFQKLQHNWERLVAAGKTQGKFFHNFFKKFPRKSYQNL